MSSLSAEMLLNASRQKHSDLSVPPRRSASVIRRSRNTLCNSDKY
jgi:hypothetical protein